MRFTILGSTGFIGREMVRYLRERGDDVETFPRYASFPRENLGHVIYAIGLTGNFRVQPYAAIEAHVNVLHELIEKCDFESWLYLSSTRIYGGLPADTPANESTAISVHPGLDSVFDLSKLLGESLCLARDRKTVRVARLSNVCGFGQSEYTFLGSIIRDLVLTGRVVIGESPRSSKDYISIGSAVEALASIATAGTERIYNVASGRRITHAQIADVFRGWGYDVQFAANGPTRVFPPINTNKITKEFGDIPCTMLEDLPLLVESEKRRWQTDQTSARRSTHS